MSFRSLSSPPTASLEPEGSPPPSGAGHAIDDLVAVPERRSRPRAPLEVEITLGSESHFYAGITNDLSTGGVFVVTYASHVVGAELDLEFRLPSATVRATGQVCWLRHATESTPPGVGIRFTALSEDDRLEVERFCLERAPLYYDVGAE